MPDKRGLLLAVLLPIMAGLALAWPVAATPAEATGHLAAARGAVQRGDGIAAEAELRKALSAGASRRDVAAQMGAALLLQGDLRHADEWLGPGDFAPGEAALGWRIKGQLLRREGRLGEAGEALDRALALAPEDPRLWVEVARLRYVGGEHLLAIAAARRAAALGPGEPEALELQAQLVRDRAGPVAALPQFARALGTVPGDRALLLGLAATQGDAGDAAGMLNTTRTVQANGASEPLPFLFQAILAARAGDTGLARSLLNRTTGRLDDMPAAMLLTGALELEAGNAALAVEVLERLDRRQPENPRVWQLYAKALHASGDYRRLFERFDPLAARPDAPPYLLWLLGRAREETGDRAVAAQLLDRAALTTAPPFPAVSAGAAVSARPGSFDGFVNTGDAAMERGEFLAAYAAYGQAAGIRYPEWLMFRAVVALDRAGQGGEAAVVAGRYAAGFPGSLLAPRLLAASAAGGNDWARARLLLENLNRRTGQQDERLLADLSLAQLRQGDAVAALASAEAAYRLNRASPIAAKARGMALAAARRDADMAEALLAKAQRMSGDSPLLAEARRQLSAR
jgi:tetratricopeptide (TPR) repeat protein